MSHNGSTKNEYFQGIGTEWKGIDEKEKERRIVKLEKTGRWVAQPKIDGLWYSIETGKRSYPTFRTSSGRESTLKDLETFRFPKNSIVVGKLIAGTSRSKRVRAKLKRQTIVLWDCLQFDGVDLRHLPREKREIYLRSWIINFYDENENGSEYISQITSTSSGFLKMYKEQEEGIVLKPANGKKYFSGDFSKSKRGNVLYSSKQDFAHWIKIKHSFEDDYIVLGYKANKGGDYVSKMELGAWIPEFRYCARDKKILDRRLINDQPYVLVRFYSAWIKNNKTLSKYVLNNFDEYEDKVISVTHAGLSDNDVPAGQSGFCTILNGDLKVRETNPDDIIYRNTEKKERKWDFEVVNDQNQPWTDRGYEIERKWSTPIIGSLGDRYEVKWTNEGHKRAPLWNYVCTCNSNQRTGEHCKHIKKVIRLGVHIPWERLEETMVSENRVEASSGSGVAGNIVLFLLTVLVSFFVHFIRFIVNFSIKGVTRVR